MITALSSPGRRPAYDWVSPTAAAERLGVQVRDIYRLIDTGNLPGYRIVDEVRLLAHEVDEFGRRSLT
jgi:excisionase family DNA binding protein